MSHPCPDCGKELETPYHACLDPQVAAAYIHDLRDMNARKNERIEKLEGALAGVIQKFDAEIESDYEGTKMLKERLKEIDPARKLLNP